MSGHRSDTTGYNDPLAHVTCIWNSQTVKITTHLILHQSNTNHWAGKFMHICRSNQRCRYSRISSCWGFCTATTDLVEVWHEHVSVQQSYIVEVVNISDLSVLVSLTLMLHMEILWMNKCTLLFFGIEVYDILTVLIFLIIFLPCILGSHMCLFSQWGRVLHSDHMLHVEFLTDIHHAQLYWQGGATIHSHFCLAGLSASLNQTILQNSQFYQMTTPAQKSCHNEVSKFICNRWWRW
jgi:hypothetical protein